MDNGYYVVGYDNVCDYYDVSLKHARLDILNEYEDFHFVKADLEDKETVDKLFKDFEIDYVVNLAAQAGVRYSLEHPHTYIKSNIEGFLNILEACRFNNVKHLVYASSSSVYGGNNKYPSETNDNVDHPVSLYAASKKANELMAHTYSHLFNVPTTGLRFFTVYGPYGRPDMALFLFTKAILEDKEIKVFNHGDMERDFTYVDDIVEGIFRLVPKAPKGDGEWNLDTGDTSKSWAPYKVYNIGNNNPEKLMDFISAIEKKIGKEAKKNFMDMQAGDVKKSYADVADLVRDIDYSPNTDIEEGVSKFIDWYREYYNV